METNLTYYRRCLGCGAWFTASLANTKSPVPFYHAQECKPAPSTMDRLESALVQYLEAELAD